MRKIAFGIAAAFAMAGAVQAAPMDTAYGNTVVVTYPGGVVSKLYVEADGTYTATSPMGAVKGTWAIADGQTCFTQTEPAGVPASCGPTVDKQIGDTWDGVGVGGAPVTLTLVAGR